MEALYSFGMTFEGSKYAKIGQVRVKNCY